MGSNVPVVVTRKHKELHKGWHALAFVLTLGNSAPITLWRLGANRRYNEKTRQLNAVKNVPHRGTQVTWTKEELEYARAHTARPR